MFRGWNITQHKLVGKAGAGPISSKRHGRRGATSPGARMPLSLSYSAYVQPRPVTISRHLRSVSFVGCADLLVEHLTCDSRECRPGSLFAVIPGTNRTVSSSFPKRWDAERGHCSSSIRWRDSRQADRRGRCASGVCPFDTGFVRLSRPTHGCRRRHRDQRQDDHDLAGALDAGTGRRRCGLLGTIEYDDGARCTRRS